MKVVSKIHSAFNKDYAPTVGAYVMTDNWRPFGCLLQGDNFSSFRIEITPGGPIKDIAIEVEITGRLAQYFEGGWWIRCKITYPGDGEPDSVCRGWLFLDYRSEV